MSKNNQPYIIISRTIYDPDKKDFITSTPNAKALPHIKAWINQHDPKIYWYILRLDNPSDNDISQWAVELYAYQALTISEAYIEGSDRKFELRKERHDPWTEKWVLPIPRQFGIPIVGKGTRRIFFKVDIDCKEGLMYEYDISGAFIALGMESLEIKEKMFQYSCKAGEFRQIFNNNPDAASMYAEKYMEGKYDPKSLQFFINGFREIHKLNVYCHSVSLKRDDLLQKLHFLHDYFELMPDIASERITPCINDSIREFDIIVDTDKLTSRVMKLCDELIELLYLAMVRGDPGSSPPVITIENKDEKNKCPVCRNGIEASNKLLICEECGKEFCTTCEAWWRIEERKRGQKPLCEDCFQDKQIQIIKRLNQEIKLVYQEIECVKQEIEKQIDKKLATEGNSIGMKFMLIPAGEFIMGSKNGTNNEQPVHKVTISKPFYLGTYPVTQREWKKVMGNNPSCFKGNDLPIEDVSWDDFQEFIKKLNDMEGTDKYRLPSEAEWEYAARAGTTTNYYFGDDESKLSEYVWYGGNSGKKTHPVGKKKSNSWGLYDMHGNVWEWVQDEWHGNYKDALNDGSVWERGNKFSRVFRGGSWSINARSCRSAFRSHYDPGLHLSILGFRLLREI